MRKTLHDYVIEQFEKWKSFPSEESSYLVCYKYAKLTNRAPRLGDFVPCNEDGNVLEKPKNYDKWLMEDYYTEVEISWIRDCAKYKQALDRVIFKGDWEVVYNEGKLISVLYEPNLIQFTSEICLLGVKEITRIEDLPREIEFKEGVV